MQGKEIEGRTCTSIRLFSMCRAMKWAHLPVAGGLYDQHPKLLDDFMYIFSKQSEWDEQERKREKRKQESDKMKKIRNR